MPTCVARRKLFPKHPGSNEAVIEGFGFSMEYLADRDHQFRFFPLTPNHLQARIPLHTCIDCPGPAGVVGADGNMGWGCML